jgi:CRP/FNR family transcriptional regulator, polysaccharide utilization system transcription regulator
MTNCNNFDLQNKITMRKGNASIDCTNCESRAKSIFCTIHESDVEAINSSKRGSNYKKGQIIFNQHSAPHGIFVIYSGKVKVFQLAENGKEQIVRMVKEGDIIGYRALLSNENYSSTAEALVDSNICFIPKELFFGIMNKNSSITEGLMQYLTKDLKHAESKITGLAQKSVKERMAEALLFIKETYGFENDNKTINVVLTREDFANLVGTATETAIRLLSVFKSQNLIDFNGKKIKLLNVPQLTFMANVND